MPAAYFPDGTTLSLSTTTLSGVVINIKLTHPAPETKTHKPLSQTSGVYPEIVSKVSQPGSWSCDMMLDIGSTDQVPAISTADETIIITDPVANGGTGKTWTFTGRLNAVGEITLEAGSEPMCTLSGSVLSIPVEAAVT